MSYNAIAEMARDGDLQQRFIACAAQEGIENPETWVRQNIWQLCAAPGLADSYEYAVNTDKITPGKLEDVISDATILATVQARETELNPA
jgi:hypothetical protein